MISNLLTRVKPIWEMVQDLLSVKGGLYVDALCLVIIVRVLAVLWGFAPLTGAEAGIWSATICAYGYTKGKS
jgi:hypothetical protein